MNGSRISIVEMEDSVEDKNGTTIINSFYGENCSECFAKQGNKNILRYVTVESRRYCQEVGKVN